jgi:hypothetical protein
MIQIIFLALTVLFTSVTIKAQNIQTAQQTPREEKTKILLEDLLKTYDLTSYTFTRDIQIEEKVISHSHPILTLNTRYLEDPPRLLATYLHEQIHWHLMEKNSVESYIQEVKAKYPKLPVGRDEGGALDEYSSYLHMAVCTLELQALDSFLGKNEAEILFRTDLVYPALKKIIVSDRSFFEDLITKHKLTIK